MNTDHQNNEEENISRVLKKLTPLKTSDDFNLRLGQRILSEGNKTVGNMSFERIKIFFRYRLPIYGVPALAIIVIGLLSYYAFVRDGISPREISPLTERKSKIEMQSPSELSSDEINTPTPGKVSEGQSANKITKEKKPHSEIETGELMRGNEQNRLLNSVKNVTKTEQAGKDYGIKMDRVRTTPAPEVANEKHLVQHALIPRITDKKNILEARGDKLEITYIDTTSRVDTSKIDSIKIIKP
jgi:hypothetical protein